MYERNKSLKRTESNKEKLMPPTQPSEEQKSAIEVPLREEIKREEEVKIDYENSCHTENEENKSVIKFQKFNSLINFTKNTSSGQVFKEKVSQLLRESI